MLEKTDVTVHLLGDDLEKIFKVYPWIENIDMAGSEVLQTTKYCFRIWPSLPEYLQKMFLIPSPKQMTNKLELAICLNMNQEKINNFAKLSPHILFVNFEQSGYKDPKDCILNYPECFNEKILLANQGKKITLVKAAVNTLSIPKELVAYILQWYICLELFSPSPTAFTFFGRQPIPRSNREQLTHFALDAIKSIEDATKNALEEISQNLNSFKMRFN